MSSGVGRVFVPRSLRTLEVCYGSPASVRTLTGSEDMVQEVETALFTAGAIAQEAPHDCVPFFWLDWVSMRAYETESGKESGVAGGGGVCPCADVLDCPLGVQHDG